MRASLSWLPGKMKSMGHGILDRCLVLSRVLGSAYLGDRP